MLLFLSQKLQNFISSEFAGDNVSKGYDCLCDLLSDCEEALTSFKFENVYQVLKFTSVNNVAEDPLPVHFIKVVLLRT